MNFLSKFKNSFKKTRENVFGKLKDLTGFHAKLDDEVIDEIEEILIESDIGVETSMQIVEDLKERVKENGDVSTDIVFDLLRDQLIDVFKETENNTRIQDPLPEPYVIMVVGVNGSGKTTTIGKLANMYRQQGKKVLLSAADTFRAAAYEQLNIWKDRAGVEIIKSETGIDPASVAYDSFSAAKARNIDVLIVDTAGRLHVNKNLMEELKKIKRVIRKLDENTPHEILLVLDANTGQNAISQAKIFSEALDVTGLVLTKTEGTAKGGVIIPVVKELKIPVKFLGIGEQINDILPFDSESFIEALVGKE